MRTAQIGPDLRLLQISLSILNQGLGSNQPQFFVANFNHFFFQEKVQNQLSQHMNAFKQFLHLKVLTSMKMVVVLRMMHKTLQ